MPKCSAGERQQKTPDFLLLSLA
ncbi:hypothetical protein [Acetobacter estunensis]